MKHRQTRRLTWLTILSFGVSGSALAQAQQGVAAPQEAPAPQAAPPAAGTDQGADIIVTATRRNESLQRVPVAISVVTGETLRAANLNNLRDIATIVPALNYRTAASAKDQALILRGLGTVSTSPGVEPSVSTVIDGVVIARQGQAAMDLLDVDRIEVLRGPQGTLFGKNASIGVLNIVTRKPTDEFHAFVDGGYYTDHNERRIQGGISGGLVPGKITAEVTGFAAKYDGNVRNIYLDKEVNGYSRYGTRAKVSFTPTENLSFLLIGDYVHSRDTTPQGVVTRSYKTAYPTNAVTNYPAFESAFSPAVASADNRTTNTDFDTFAIDKNYGVSLEGDLSLGDYTLTSITAYRHWDNEQHQDRDRLSKAVIGIPMSNDQGLLAFHQLSQEVRLASPKESLIDYVVGLYYFHGRDDETYQRDTTTLTATSRSTVTGVAVYGVTNDSYAGFGEANIHLSSRLTGIAGLRLTHDRVSYDFARTSTSSVPVSGIQTAFNSTGSTTATDFTSRLGLQYRVDPSVMTYATYSRGYKGPAYNISFSMLPQDTPPARQETSNAFEFGIKSRLAGGAVVLNIAAFLDKFKNYQVNYFDTANGSLITRLINAGRVSTRGVEADATVRAGRLTLNGSGAYTDAHIDSFSCPAGTTSSCDINGKPLPYAPRWKGSLRANYGLPLSNDLTLNIGSDVNAQTKVQYSINQTPDTIQSSYGIWNATIGLATKRGWTLNFVAKNLTNKSYAAFLTTFDQGIVRFVPRDDRRYYGFNLHIAY